MALNITGFCDSRAHYNDIYYPMGVTASGRPWYMNSFAAIYWDPHCDGGDSTAPRWILRSGDGPSETASKDLDGDGTCSYVGDISGSTEKPPNGTHVWGISCSNDVWEYLNITIEPVSFCFRSDPTVVWTSSAYDELFRLSGSFGSSCYIDANCFGTGSANGKYTNLETCKWEILQPAILTTKRFTAESGFDELRIHGQSYSSR